MQRRSLAAVCIAAAMWAQGAQAITLIFDWSAASGTETTDPSVTATGRLDIGVGAGETFSLGDLDAIYIEVTGALIDDFVIDGTETTQFLAGQVAPDAGSATLSDFLFANVDIEGNYVNGFGCEFGPPDTAEFCGLNFPIGGDPDRPYNIVNGPLTGTPADKAVTRYGSAAEALASISLTAANVTEPEPIPAPAVVPLPASAPLLAAGLGLLAVWRRWRSVRR